MAVVAVSLLSVLLTGCIPARAGARCRTTDFGHDARNVLVCRDGRWRVLMTKQRAAEVLLSLAPTTTAAPGGFYTSRNSATMDITNANAADGYYALGGYGSMTSVLSGAPSGNSVVRQLCSMRVKGSAFTVRPSWRISVSSISFTPS